MSSSLKQQTISQWNCDVGQTVDFIWQLVTTNSVDGLRNSFKALPKSNLDQKRAMVAIWWPAVHPIHCSFLNPSKTITSEKDAQQIDRTHENCNACSWHWSTEKARPHNTQPMLQKLNELGNEVLPYLPHSPDLLPINYHFFKHLDNFCRKNASITRRQKVLSKPSSNPKEWIFMLQE